MPFDAAYLRHQLPGGMVGTMRRHLADHGVPHLEGAVIEEMGRVREELGWPIVMTPFAQMLQTQAVMNVTGKERYAVIPDEIIRYALGRSAVPNVPIDPEVMDKIMANPRTKELAAQPDMAELSDLRKKIGKTLSDEEFLLRAVMPANLVDAMQAAGPAERHYDPAKVPIMNLLREVLKRTDVDQLTVEKPGFRWTWPHEAAQGLHVRPRRHADPQRPLARRLHGHSRRARGALGAQRARHPVDRNDQRQRLSGVGPGAPLRAVGLPIPDARLFTPNSVRPRRWSSAATRACWCSARRAYRRS
jgi:hypothetical protein